MTLLLPKAHLLMTVPGRHTGERLRQFGHMQLREILRAETFPSKFSGCDPAGTPSKTRKKEFTARRILLRRV